MAKMKWISVKDGLPRIKDRGGNKNPSSDKVLCYSNGEYAVGCRWMCGEEEHFIAYGICDECLGEITHWMPLPNPPKE